MNSRERVLLTLDFEEPDRVPRDFWGSKGFYSLLRKERGLNKEQFLDLHDIDLRYIEGPTYVGGPPLLNDKGYDTDIWGVKRRKVHAKTACGGEEVYMEVAEHPLAHADSPEDIFDYGHWPKADWFDYSSISEQCRHISEKGRAVVFMGDRLNRVAQLKPAMYLRGIEQILVDLALSPDIVEAIFKLIRQFYLQYLERVLEASMGGIDIVLTGDDFGAQNGLLLSKAMWKQFIGQGFGEYIDIIHQYGARCSHHTCGAVSPLVPEMAAHGLDILQSLQPEGLAQDLPELKEQFAGKLAFQGAISIQHTLPSGSPEEIRKEVKDRIKTLAPGGGYILGTAHNIQADCPLENVDALLDAYERFGYYPEHSINQRQHLI